MLLSSLLRVSVAFIYFGMDGPNTAKNDNRNRTAEWPAVLPLD